MITEDDNIRGRAATMKRRDVQDQDVPWEVIVLAFITFVGFLTILTGVAYAVLILTR